MTIQLLKNKTFLGPILDADLLETAMSPGHLCVFFKVAEFILFHSQNEEVGN